MAQQYDLAIVGGACAGLAAATYAARRALKTVVLTKDIGGQIATTPTVENYPAIAMITGPDLASQMYVQALEWGAEVRVGTEVSEFTKNGERDFTVSLRDGTSISAKAILLAYGKTPRSLDVPGEWEYAGKGVSYCVTCDAPLFRKKVAAVVGGGNSAVEGALILARTSEKVYLVHRRDEFRAEQVLIDELKNTPNVELVLSAVSKEVQGDGSKVTHLAVTTPEGERLIEVHGIFVEIGFVVQTELVKGKVELDRLNQVVTNKKMETSEPGIFAAGDITDSPFKQAVISAGEGAAAALTAYAYITGQQAGVDWGK